MRGHFINLLRFLALIPAAVAGLSIPAISGSTYVSDQHQHQHRPANALLPLTTKQDTILVAAPDGTIYLVEITSRKILWSFPSGPPIYSSYQALPLDDEKHDALRQNNSFFIDCGDDWELYMYGKDSKAVKLPFGAEELLRRTPYILTDGVMLGTKQTTAFLVDAKSGKVIYTFRSTDLPSAGHQSAEENPSLGRKDVEEWLHSTPVDLKAVDRPLYIKRTDYGLTYSSSKTGNVLWYLTFADIEASRQCPGVDIFFGESEIGSEFKSDARLPEYCQSKLLVYRIRDHSSLESIFESDWLPMSLPGSGMLSLPAPDQGSHENDEVKEVLALPAPPTEVPGIVSAHREAERDINSSIPPENQSSFLVWLLVLFVAPFLTIAFLLYYWRSTYGKEVKSNKQAKDLKVPSEMPKKKKARKSGSNRPSAGIEKRKKNVSHDNTVGGINGLQYVERTEAKLHLAFDYGDGLIDTRKVGKLLVSNNEIAKGSNGTIVLEGIYDGRQVAVKRLVKTHHDVALKEIQNLIASDQHPNIVRWYGVDYDQDFVYISLERCVCSLHELIVAYTDSSHKQIITKDEDPNSLTNSVIQLQRTVDIFKDCELWKANGYPSPHLLKVMRDIVNGLVHLHELGIIHRDLKPQNVLVLKDRAISAKVSDMGISKRLTGDMSSLTKQATGYGSSGWQAPEQLRHERQTRAVDLFSLGCLLFFCITGGRHPFGDPLERDINVLKNRKDLFLIENIPDALDLISHLLDPNPELRPKAIEVLHHPLFWSPEMRLSFLRDASDRVELEDREGDSELLKALESIATVALGGKWDEKMDNTFINDIGRYRRYKYDSVRDLLRVIRNKLNHYRELPKDIQGILGQVPEGFERYFGTKFPKLVIEVYNVLKRYCGEEEFLQKYFKDIQI